MFDNGAAPAGDTTTPTATVPAAVPSVTVPSVTVPSGTVAAWIAALTGLDRAVDDAERITQLGLLERLKAAAAAAQAVVTADFASSQRAQQKAAGVPAARVGQGIGAQIGLARRDSPFRGGRHLGLAQALTCELPHTMAALRSGDTTEWRATILARETACLTVTDRAIADAELGPLLANLGDRDVESRARAAAYRLDPHAFLARVRGATADRRVSLRPAPDTMSRLTGFLPVAQGVAAYAALTQEADRVIAAGDPRSRAQIMADTYLQRLTGQSGATATPVEVHLLMTEASLFGTDHNTSTTTTTSDRPGDSHNDDGHSDTGGEDHSDRDRDDNSAPDVDYGPGNGTYVPANPGHTDASADSDDSDASEGDASDDHVEGVDDGHELDGVGGVDEPAILLGAGPIPAAAARDLLRDTTAQVWLRRVYTRPADGALIAMDSRRRIFPTALRHLLLIRDQYCRTPWCGAPIRHTDHITPHTDHGPTSATNGQGLCAACNYAKQAPGWRARPGPGVGAGAGQRVDLTTPTGHTYTSHPPPPPGAPPPHKRDEPDTPGVAVAARAVDTPAPGNVAITTMPADAPDGVDAPRASARLSQIELHFQRLLDAA